MRAHLIFRQLFQRREIDFLDQPAVQPDFGVEQLVAEQRLSAGGCGLLLTSAGCVSTGGGVPSSTEGGTTGAAGAGSGAAARRAVNRLYNGFP
jgi:hypothetical protein